MCKNNASEHYYYSSARGSGGRLFPSKVEFGSFNFHLMSYLVHVLPDKTIFVDYLHVSQIPYDVFNFFLRMNLM